MSEQRRLDIMLHIALFESIFGASSPEYWSRTIRDLLRRGATLDGIQPL